MDENITISNMVSRIKGSVSLELAKKLMDRVEAYGWFSREAHSTVWRQCTTEKL